MKDDEYRELDYCGLILELGSLSLLMIYVIYLAFTDKEEKGEKNFIEKKDDKDDKDDKQKHVECKSISGISPDINVQKENLLQVTQSKSVTKELALKETPTESKKPFGSQNGGDKDGINVSLLMPLVQKAELSWSNIQILCDLFLKIQLDNPQEVTEWTEGHTDSMIQLNNKIKALSEKYKASLTYQNNLKDLEAELNSERSKLTGSFKQLEEAINAIITEAQALHTRLQHILESHAAEKQGFIRQIKQLQAKFYAVGAIIYNKQEDQSQMQRHPHQELIAQCQHDDGQIDYLQSELMKKLTEFYQLEAQVESLQLDRSNYSSFTKRLQDDLEAQRLKNNNEAIGDCSSLDQSVDGLSSECIEPEQLRASTVPQLPGVEKPLISNLEPEICSITSIKSVVKSQQDFNCNSFISGSNSDNLHTAAHDGQFINGQQPKKHKKKRKLKQK